MSFLHFSRDICGDFESATGREWLVTHGIGGCASGLFTPLSWFAGRGSSAPPERDTTNVIDINGNNNCHRPEGVAWRRGDIFSKLKWA